MKNFINKYYFGLIFLVIFIIVIFSILIGNKDKDGIKKNSKYTIGFMVSNWHHKNNRGVGTDFKYFVNGMTIKKTGPYNLKNGEMCLIMFDSLKPYNCLMLGKHKFYEDTQVPPSGWEFNEIPISIDSADLEFYFKKLKIE